MASPTNSLTTQDLASVSVRKAPLPILYEDDEEGDLGESNPHVLTDEVVHICLLAHFADRPEYQVFSNMNLYYEVEAHEVRPLPYVSPDVMVLTPFQRLPEDIRSYQIGRDGPAPVLVVEILSERSAQQRDLAEKVILYAVLGIAEYILVDVTGMFLPQRLWLKRLQTDGRWQDERDSDGGVTSRLGFRLLIDTDGRLRVLNGATEQAYVRPDEAEKQVRQLQVELARLRQVLQEGQKPGEG